MKKNVLVVPAGTEIGHEIFEALRYSRYWNLIGANSVKDHSEILYDTLIQDFPNAYDPGFTAAVNAAIDAHKIDFVFPAHDEVIFQLAGNIRHAVFAGPSRRNADILRSKSRTIEALRDVLPVPEIYSPDAPPPGFPLFAKPDRGQGSRGAVVVRSAEQFDALRRADPGLVFQELLPGQEVTVDCYSSRSGAVLYAQPRLRERVSMGIATRVSALEDPVLRAHADAISQTLGLFGPWFFQMKKDASGTYKLLEVANRVAGSMGFQRNLGANLIDAFLHELDGRPVRFYQNPIDSLLYDRALYEKMRWDYRPSSIYVDFDDTLHFENGAVHYTLIGILYGCKINLGAKIILLTRHGEDLTALLRSLGFEGLFDTIIHMDRQTPKSVHVTDPQAVFIDDSYAEREEVFRIRNIPCFPLEACRILEGCLTACASR